MNAAPMSSEQTPQCVVQGCANPGVKPVSVQVMAATNQSAGRAVLLVCEEHYERLSSPVKSGEVSFGHRPGEML